MARIKGIDIPNEKRVEIALTYIYGIGRSLSNTILKDANVDKNKKAKDLTEEEIPHSVTCIVEEIEEDEKMLSIASTIIVDRENLKKIIIGKNGSKIKEIGTRARKDIEAYYNKKVYLDLFVKVVPKWRDKEKFLNMIGFKDFLNK